MLIVRILRDSLKGMAFCFYLMQPTKLELQEKSGIHGNTFFLFNCMKATLPRRDDLDQVHRWNSNVRDMKNIFHVITGKPTMAKYRCSNH